MPINVVLLIHQQHFTFPFLQRYQLFQLFILKYTLVLEHLLELHQILPRFLLVLQRGLRRQLVLKLVFSLLLQLFLLRRTYPPPLRRSNHLLSSFLPHVYLDNLRYVGLL